MVQINYQLKVLLNPYSLKVLEYLMSFQKCEKVYVSLNSQSRLLKIDKDVMERALQCLIDNSLISLEREGLSWICNFNEEAFENFKNIPMKDLTEYDELALSDDVRFTSRKTKTVVIEDGEELEKQLFTLQRKINSQ